MSRDPLRLFLAHHHSNETSRYIISVAGSFKLIFIKDRDEIRKAFDNGTGYQYKIPFFYTFNKFFNKARAQMCSRSSSDLFGTNFFD